MAIKLYFLYSLLCVGLKLQLELNVVVIILLDVCFGIYSNNNHIKKPLTNRHL